jgi:hypothetical protein
MKRLRMLAFAAVANLAFIPGCCCFDGQLLNRMGMGPRPDPCCECGGGGCATSGCATCGCATCGSGPMMGDGPDLGYPNGFGMPGPGGVREQGPDRIVPQPAQPMPAPVSTTRIR